MTKSIPEWDPDKSYHTLVPLAIEAFGQAGLLVDSNLLAAQLEKRIVEAVRDYRQRALLRETIQKVGIEAADRILESFQSESLQHLDGI